MVQTGGRKDTASDVHDGTGQRPRDPLDRLDLGDDELAELVDVVRLGADDHVVGSGDVFGQGHTLNAGDLTSHVGSLADLGLDEDVGLHHHVLPGTAVRRPPYRVFTGGRSSPSGNSASSASSHVSPHVWAPDPPSSWVRATTPRSSPRRAAGSSRPPTC